MSDDRRSLSPLTQEAYNALTAAIDHDEIVTRKHASMILRDHEFEKVTAESLLQTLLDQGFLYEVNGKLRITGN